jgi:hypothetical protein
MISKNSMLSSTLKRILKILPSPKENNCLEWHHQLPSDKAVLHKFMWEWNGLNKTAAQNITENSRSDGIFLLYFQTVLEIMFKKPTDNMQLDTQAGNKLDITYSQHVIWRIYIHSWQL